MKQFKKSVFIFRRDLRIFDNTGLIEAMHLSEEVLCCFIFHPDQLKNHPYKSEVGLQFLLECLQDLEIDIEKHFSKLMILFGKPEEVLKDLKNKYNYEAIFVNKDYTPFSRERDKKIQQFCEEHTVLFSQHDDALLHAPGSILKDNGEPYTIFTPFYKKSLTKDVLAPKHIHDYNFSQNYKDISIKQYPYHKLTSKDTKSKRYIFGGKAPALSILKNVKQFKNYKIQRDIPELNATTHLSAYNKFGVISIRQIYSIFASTFGEESNILREFYWRDFFTHIAFHFPKVFQESFQERFKNIAWKNDIQSFKKWCEGKTGFPIVDAGMRELNETGYMHNRVRMITASFLVKDLHIDWRWGEKYFATRLVDYDPAVNNGNWQWAASTGCDAQPYFRIFNPWLQQKKFDPECVYIKKWIPELSSNKPQEIHNLVKKGNIFLSISGYPQPMVDHSLVSKEVKKLFENAKSL